MHDRDSRKFKAEFEKWVSYRLPDTLEAYLDQREAIRGLLAIIGGDLAHTEACLYSGEDATPGETKACEACRAIEAAQKALKRRLKAA